jgi:hypothetical protein
MSLDDGRPFQPALGEEGGAHLECLEVVPHPDQEEADV